MRFLAALGMTMLFVAITFATNAQQVIDVRGAVMDSATHKPLNKTTVIRLSDNAVFFTDSLGRFDITCTRNDAVRFNYVGYKTVRLVVANAPDSVSGWKKFLRVGMAVDKQALQQVTVQGTKQPHQTDSIYYEHALKPMEATLLQSPITAIYNEFSKKEKEKRQLQEILQQDYLKDLFRYRMPRQRLLNITGDKAFTPEEMQRRCPMSEFFLLNASDYDLYNYAKGCYAEYLKSGY